MRYDSPKIETMVYDYAIKPWYGDFEDYNFFSPTGHKEGAPQNTLLVKLCGSLIKAYKLTEHPF